MTQEKLRDTIWITRISRVKAERRLLDKNSFIQGINIYYSCITIIFSICSLLEVFKANDILSIITVFMTISLLITILYLNSLKYEDIARCYRDNYTDLYKLELELGHDISSERLASIEKEYCELLAASCNHITYDYYCTIHEANDDFKKDKWKSIRHKYWFGYIWRLLVKVFTVLFPVGLCVLLLW
ncbi:MAG: SLATT domain-containing protein [Ruminococcus sp.]|nr:SLATT domain-containing protein [Ruminococcus sp.]